MEPEGLRVCPKCGRAECWGSPSYETPPQPSAKGGVSDRKRGLRGLLGRLRHRGGVLAGRYRASVGGLHRRGGRGPSSPGRGFSRDNLLGLVGGSSVARRAEVE